MGLQPTKFALGFRSWACLFSENPISVKHEVLIQRIHVRIVRLLQSICRLRMSTDGSLGVTDTSCLYRTCWEVFGSRHNNGEGLLVLDTTVHNTHQVGIKKSVAYADVRKGVRYGFRFWGGEMKMERCVKRVADYVVTATIDSWKDMWKKK